MRRYSPRARLWRRTATVVAAALAVGLIALVFRTLSVGGMFAEVNPHVDGTCHTIAALPVAAMAADPAHHRVFLAVAGAGAADGIYLFVPGSSAPPRRLSGTPAGFHPVALALAAEQGGGEVLMAGGPAAPRTGSIVLFAVDDSASVPALRETATIGSSLFAHLTALAAAGPGSFYAADAPAQATDFVSLMLANVQPGGGRIIYYDGQMPHVVAQNLRAPRGLALSPDGSRLFVAAEIARAIDSYDIAPFTGRLTYASQYTLPIAPAQLALNGHGLIVAGDPKLFARDAYRRDRSRPSPSEVVEVSLTSGSASAVTPLLVAAGASLADADAAARLGDHLVVGSALGRKLLDCRLH